LDSFSDEQLVKSCKAGNQQHCGLLYERHKDYVAYIAWKTVGDAELARDLTQDTFLRAFKGLKRFKGDSSFKTWLTRIVVNLCKDRRKSAEVKHGKSHIHLGGPEDGGVGEIPADDPESNPERQLLQKERKTAVGDAIDKLSPDHKEVMLFYQQDFTYAEISKITGISVKTVGSRIHYAKLALRKLLKHYMKGRGR